MGLIPLMDRFQANDQAGLSETEARKRLAVYGPDSFTEEKQEPSWKEFLEELHEPMVLLLLITGVLYAFGGEPSDTSTILDLFAAVTAVYLVTWYGTQSQVTSQTVAFFAWLIGHILLAFNMCPERQPIFQLGMGSNRMMLIWEVAAAVFILLITFIPGAQHLMKVKSHWDFS
jgi:magnesium-transporting ATPase (P-type)